MDIWCCCKKRRNQHSLYDDLDDVEFTTLLTTNLNSHHQNTLWSRLASLFRTNKHVRLSQNNIQFDDAFEDDAVQLNSEDIRSLLKQNVSLPKETPFFTPELVEMETQFSKPQADEIPDIFGVGK